MTSKNPRPAKDILSELEALEQGDELDGASYKTYPKPLQDSKSPQEADADLLAGLDIPERQRTGSRPHTPRVPSSATTQSSKRTGVNTPPSNDGTRSSEEKPQPRKSVDSSRSFRAGLTPATEAEVQKEPEKAKVAAPQEPQSQNSGGGWWGGIFGAASAAVKQAEALAKEIQRNEEAQRWAEQVKGNVGVLRGLGGELRSRALPTFTNIIHTLAPPISSHERLQIHITHDIVGYPSLDPLIYATFSRVMAQVEGGDLMVIQRGQESSRRRGSDAGGFTGSSNSGWSDGPWWRQAAEGRSLGAVKGLVEGTKLSRVSAESYANEYYAARGGLENAAQQATEVLSESNPVRTSDIFLAIQAISHTTDNTLFQSAPTEKSDQGVVEPEEGPDEVVCFAIYLHDPIHGITFNSVSQTLPQKWLDWLDASAAAAAEGKSALPEEIAEIVESGGVDPREWVAEWVEETLSLGVGTVAQRYVARRMGVGHGGIGKGKARQQALEAGGGEAARVV